MTVVDSASSPVVCPYLKSGLYHVTVCRNGSGYEPLQPGNRDADTHSLPNFELAGCPGRVHDAVDETFLTYTSHADGSRIIWVRFQRASGPHGISWKRTTVAGFTPVSGSLTLGSRLNAQLPSNNRLLWACSKASAQRKAQDAAQNFMGDGVASGLQGEDDDRKHPDKSTKLTANIWGSESTSCTG